jgi:hypothetical protein
MFTPEMTLIPDAAVRQPPYCPREFMRGDRA